MDPVALILGILIGAALGVLGARVLASSGQQRDTARLAALEAGERAARAELDRTIEGYEATIERLRADAAAQYERERAEAEARERRAEAEARVLTALAPVRDRLEHMHRTVASIEEQRLQQHGELSEQLRVQFESDERLRAATDSLTQALRSSTARGSWGEAQLRNVVESAGMLERVDFVTQATVSGEAGSRRPDMIVNLPGGKHLAIDAKAPLTQYLAASELAASNEPGDVAHREELLRAHAKAVRRHVAALAERRYPSAIDSSPELVIAFLPSESALSAAVSADPALLDDAMARGVALTSPVSLWSVLRSIAFAWQQEVLTDSAKQVFDTSRLLYQRLATAATHVDQLGRSLSRTIGHYNAFVGSLETRVLPTARRLSELDPTTAVPDATLIDDTPRTLSAPELTDALALAERDSA